MQRSRILRQFEIHLRLERGLTDNTIKAYVSDVQKLFNFLGQDGEHISLKQIDQNRIHLFLQSIHDLGLQARTQARILSGLRIFFEFLQLEALIDSDPTTHIEGPKISRKIPDILSIDQIENMLEHALSMTKDVVVNKRNHAIIELLYATGLRVSELVELKKIQLNFDNSYLRVIGKGRKERLVPFHQKSQQAILTYWSEQNIQKPQLKQKDHVFLNRRGFKLSRNMVFIMIKNCAEMAGINKPVSPHLFRHSFASHLVERGADIRIVQELLGHASILTTEIYTHFEIHHLRDTLETCHPVYIANQQSK